MFACYCTLLYETTDYDTSMSAAPLATSYDLLDGDCRSLVATSEDDYESCAHVSYIFQPRLLPAPSPIILTLSCPN
jgi:hypothetical protein